MADKSGHYTPKGWAQEAIDLYYDINADAIVVETNFGADMVEDTIYGLDSNVIVETVHASKGKTQRAEPVVAKYEQDEVRHATKLPELEMQMCTWKHGSTISPGRIDALVWGMTYLKERVDVYKDWQFGYHEIE